MNCKGTDLFLINKAFLLFFDKLIHDFISTKIELLFQQRRCDNYILG